MLDEVLKDVEDRLPDYRHLYTFKSIILLPTWSLAKEKNIMTINVNLYVFCGQNIKFFTSRNSVFLATPDSD